MPNVHIYPYIHRDWVAQWVRLFDYLTTRAHLLSMQYFSYIMATRFNGGKSQNTRKEPPTMGKRLVILITCWWNRVHTFFEIYKAGRESTTLFCFFNNIKNFVALLKYVMLIDGMININRRRSFKCWMVWCSKYLPQQIRNVIIFHFSYQIKTQHSAFRDISNYSMQGKYVYKEEIV
jgi:hypothetical protein